MCQNPMASAFFTVFLHKCDWRRVSITQGSEPAQLSKMSRTAQAGAQSGHHVRIERCQIRPSVIFRPLGILIEQEGTGSRSSAFPANPADEIGRLDRVASPIRTFTNFDRFRSAGWLERIRWVQVDDQGGLLSCRITVSPDGSAHCAPV